MKEQGTGKGKNDTSNEMISLVPSGEILPFMDIQIAGKCIRYYFAEHIFCHWSLSMPPGNIRKYLVF